MSTETLTPPAENEPPSRIYGRGESTAVFSFEQI